MENTHSNSPKVEFQQPCVESDMQGLLHILWPDMSLKHNSNHINELEPQTIEEAKLQLREYKLLAETLIDQKAALRSLIPTKNVNGLNDVFETIQDRKSNNEKEKEIKIATQTIQRLKLELQRHRKDIAEFSKLREYFESRCDDYNTQIQKLQQCLESAEEEKEIQNELLKTALEQNMELNKKLESIEMEREEKIKLRTSTSHQRKPS